MSIHEQARVRFHGVLDDKNVSAVALWRGRPLMVTDEATREGNIIQMFEAAGDEFRAAARGPIRLDPPVASPPPPPPPGKKNKLPEMDLEGITVSGDTVFVIGSHSAKRKKVDPKDKYEDNREALTGGSTAEPARDVLLRVTLDAEGNATAIDRASLRGFLLGSEPFKSCCAIASKENGPDIEGLAMHEGQLFVGFRGPVLRGNFTPVLRCTFGTPIVDPMLLFVNLGGRGIRDLAEVADGMLILAGPVGDGPGSYQVYLWDGKDGVPGKNAPASANPSGPRLIGELPDVAASAAAGAGAGAGAGANGAAAKAEGLAVLGEDGQGWDVLVVFDGLADGQGIRYRISKS